MPRFRFTRRTETRDELTVDAPTYDDAEEAMQSAGSEWRTVEASESHAGYAEGHEYPYPNAILPTDAAAPADITVE